MLERIFPKAFDNTYRGHWLGIALFAPIVFVKAAQGVVSMLTPASTMAGADGIPLDRFNPIAADTAVEMFALLGMYLLVVPVIGAVALLRYRAMIPFLFLMLLAVQLGARTLNYLHPIVRVSAGGGQPIGLYVNLAVLALTVVGFVLSVSASSARASQVEGTRP
ncbi:MAG: hypothetical protein JO056_06495 [Alphaproteobacteria bacterium]|nr:hypothetical protein [Alphaproteobacteria bacterium]